MNSPMSDFKSIKDDDKAYLFVHFKEKETPDGEQVYFGLSKDGFHWEQTNGGLPILWSYLGEKGSRDTTIVRANNGKFYIFATDLSLAYNFKSLYNSKWKEVSRNGSPAISMWESEDLIHWSEQRLIILGDENFGCMWAPEVTWDPLENNYKIHWSSLHACDDYQRMSIWYSTTSDFETFSEPQQLCKKDDAGIIDSDITYVDGWFYRFVKSDNNPSMVILERGRTFAGDYERMPAFDEETAKLKQGCYEAPALFQLKDGRWCVFLDFYGCERSKMGYVPFVAEDISTGRFIRCDEDFSFPYGFKHGNLIEITASEYQAIKEAFPN